jgi:hypothetical protein
MCKLHIRTSAVGRIARLLVFVALILFASAALAAEPAVAGAGFWRGLIDGFLSLFKLLLSPILDLTLVADDFGNWGYTGGYYLGVLLFVGTAGAAAADRRESPDIRLEVGNQSRR